MKLDALALSSFDQGAISENHGRLSKPFLQESDHSLLRSIQEGRSKPFTFVINTPVYHHLVENSNSIAKIHRDRLDLTSQKDCDKPGRKYSLRHRLPENTYTDIAALATLVYITHTTKIPTWAMPSLEIHSGASRPITRLITTELIGPMPK